MLYVFFWVIPRRLNFISTPGNYPEENIQLVLSETQIVLSETQIVLSETQIVLSETTCAV
jgi:hypothetical protein